MSLIACTPSPPMSLSVSNFGYPIPLTLVTSFLNDPITSVSTELTTTLPKPLRIHWRAWRTSFRSSSSAEFVERVISLTRLLTWIIYSFAFHDEQCFEYWKRNSVAKKVFNRFLFLLFLKKCSSKSGGNFVSLSKTTVWTEPLSSLVWFFTLPSK